MIGIRREDKSDWERRAPLTPTHVAKLVAEHGLAVLVERSATRVFTEEEYRAAGARVVDSLAACDVVMGIKELPLARIEPRKAYLFFSHTAKGQPHNMPMLARLLELECTLIDYELVTDDAGRRLVFFGRHAGHAGMIDALWALGRRLHLEGYETPFAELVPAHAYRDLEVALDAVRRTGTELRLRGLPAGCPPLVCGVLGTGNVSGGALEVLDALKPVSLEPAALLRAAGAGSLVPNVAWKVVFDLDPRYRRKDGGAVTLDELQAHPERFENGMLGYLPHVSLLVNGMYWKPALPRLLSIGDLREMWLGGKLPWMRVIADIACDIGGAVEATVKATRQDDPVYVWDVREGRAKDGFAGDGPVILAVDNLPAELPREASDDFGNQLLPFVPALAGRDWDRPLASVGLPPELSRATIAHRGRLTERFAWLAERLGGAAAS